MAEKRVRDGYELLELSDISKRGGRSSFARKMTVRWIAPQRTPGFWGSVLSLFDALSTSAHTYYLSWHDGEWCHADGSRVTGQMRHTLSGFSFDKAFTGGTMI